jgi:hypothetical protein
MGAPTQPVSPTTPFAAPPRATGGSNRWKFVAGGVALLVLAVVGGLAYSKSPAPAALGGVSSTPTPAPQPTPPDFMIPTDEPVVEGPSTTAIGETVSITCDGDPCLEIKVAKVAFATRYKDPDGYYDDKPDKGLIYMAVYVTYKATGPNASYNPFDWAIYVNDVAGQDYAYVTNGPKPELNSGELPEGKSAAGWIVYQVPPTGRITIAYQPGQSGAVFEVVVRSK